MDVQTNPPVPLTAPGDRRAQSARRIELWLCVAVTLIVAFFHVTYFTHAGGLWRDEVTSVNVASSPTVGEMWRLRDFDSFPFLWPMILRGWMKVGMGATDDRLRVLGQIAGFALLAAIWIRARVMDKGLPLFSLVLLALQPFVIRYGDSIRAYGLGLTALTLMFAAIWKLVEKPSWRRYVLAALISLIACQLLYYNTFVLFSIAVAGAIVCLRRKRYRDAAIVLAVGIPAAAAMIPYLDIASRLDSWQPLLQTPYTFSVLGEKLHEILGAPGDGVMILWGVLLVLTIIAAVASQKPKWTSKFSDEQRDIALFCLAAIVILFPLYWLFLKRLSYVTEPWYYFAVVAVSAFCIESTLRAFYRDLRIHRAALAVAGVILLSSVLLNYRLVSMRMTNVDLVGPILEQEAGPDDLIIVRPWYTGVSFERYYHGKTPWMTLPDFPSHRYHRYDIVKQMMRDPDSALDPLYAAISK
ncbi:MAG TPA: hypothetical protein VL282_18490, partial [Tepidisphaeraceae bacterium]|nr:hypothetical protein [Tepidisphaeraceae bacterium]